MITALVLIGPCGIESLDREFQALLEVVLIGPCGIETCNAAGNGSNWMQVLIGPCGIETRNR